LNQFLVPPSTLDRVLYITKIAIIVFVGVYLFGNFIPFFDGNDSYTLATIAIFLSENHFITTNELFEETGRSEFVPGDWFQTIDKKHFFPGGAAGYHYFISFLYIIGNNFSLFYLSPILGIIFLITSERVATKLFDKYVGLLTLLFLSSNHFFFRGSLSLGVDVLFSLFFVIGCYFLIKFFEDSNPKKILLASLFFVFATFVRINGIFYFPIEIFILISIFVFYRKFYLKNNSKKFFSVMYYNFSNTDKKKIFQISLLVISPWIIFLFFWFGYNEYFFGDPFTNYAIEQRGYENTDAKLSSLWNIEQKHFENFKQFSKYLLPYQFPALEKQLFDQFNYIFGTFWLGIISLFLLILSFMISLKIKQHRIKLFIFITFIIGTVWFFASVTTEERASYGVPGRYMMPVFTIFYMIMGFTIVTIFRKLNKFQNSSLNNVGKLLKISMLFLLSIFFITAFYFTPPSELLKDENFEIKNPFTLSEGHPPKSKEMTNNDVIMAIKTDRILEYGAIPFRILPINEDPSTSIELLKNLINNKYEIYIFKTPTSIHEKELFTSLTNDHNFIFKDHSQTFCKVFLSDSLNPTSISDTVCLNQ
jgi:hypothetical protein